MPVWMSLSSVATSQPTSMNKMHFTNDRLFMSVVGPGGSGKTRPIIAMLASPATFHRKFQDAYCFYMEY